MPSPFPGMDPFLESPGEWAAFHGLSCSSHRPPRFRPETRVGDPLPKIPVPLLKGDPDAVLNLQEIFTTVYERAGYDYSLDYTRPLEPPLRPEDADWVTEKVKAFLAAQRQGR